MRTLRLSVLIPVLITIPLILLVALGCRGGDEQIESSGVVEDPLLENTFSVIPGYEEHAGDVASLGEFLGGGFAVIDPGGDVIDSQTGATTQDYPELDLIESELSIDEDTGEFIVRFTCSKEPAENRFVSGYVALVDEEQEYRPVGDPFAALTTYLYFWRMNDDSYAAVMEQTNGEGVVIDDLVRLEIDEASYTLYSTYYNKLLAGQPEGSSGTLIGGITDSMGHSDWVIGARLTFH